MAPGQLGLVAQLEAVLPVGDGVDDGVFGRRPLVAGVLGLAQPDKVLGQALELHVEDLLGWVVAGDFAPERGGQDAGRNVGVKLGIGLPGLESSGRIKCGRAGVVCEDVA